MRFHIPIRARRLLVRARHNLLIQGGLLVAAFMVVATLVAYEFDVFADYPPSPQDHIVELNELLALAAILCASLLVLSWHFLLSQRREMALRVAAEMRARTLAHQDPLTGLANRRRFDAQLKAATEALPRLDGSHAVLLLDLNDFKRINDVYGHGTGDQVLVNVANRLQRAVRAGDLVARLGGDEFGILALQLVGAEEATSIALRVIQEISQPVSIGSVRHQVGVGIGIALVPQDGRSPEEVLRRADIALYRAKE